MAALPKHLNPLTPEDLEELGQIERESNDTKQVLEACTRCGLPAEEALQRCVEQATIAGNMRRDFAIRKK